MSLNFVFIFLSSIGILLALATSFLNLFTVKWGLAKEASPREDFSSYWHFCSGLLRFLIFVLIIFAGVFALIPYDHVGFIALIYANLAFTGYNKIYNKGFNHSFLYTGSKDSKSGSFMDKVFGKFMLIAEAILFLFTTLWYPLRLVQYAEFLYCRVVDDWVSFLIAFVLIVGFGIFARKFYQQKIF